MPPVPVLKPREVIAILARLGFEEVRQRGSHKRFRHPDGRATRDDYLMRAVDAFGALPPAPAAVSRRFATAPGRTRLLFREDAAQRVDVLEGDGVLAAAEGMTQEL